MRLNFDMAMLDRMSEGVVLLNRQAQVVASNTASSPWVRVFKEKGEKLKLFLDQVESRRIELPIKLNLFAKADSRGTPPADAWLCKDGMHDYAVFLSPQKNLVPSPEVADKRYIALLGEDVREQMRQLRGSLHQPDEGAERPLDAVSAQCDQLDILLKEMSDLSVVMQREHPFDDARLEIDQLLGELLPQIQKDFDNPYVFKAVGDRQGVVYGNAPWLMYALRVLLAELGRSAPLGSQVNIELRQMGGFAVLTAQVALLTKSQPLRDTVERASKTTGTGALRTARMQMAQRIIALHFGTIKMQFLPAHVGGVETVPLVELFTLTIPTGVSLQQLTHKSCSECPIAQQAQLYASDMALLLSRK